MKNKTLKPGDLGLRIVFDDRFPPISQELWDTIIAIAQLESLNDALGGGDDYINVLVNQLLDRALRNIEHGLSSPPEPPFRWEGN